MTHDGYRIVSSTVPIGYDTDECTQDCSTCPVPDQLETDKLLFDSLADVDRSARSLGDLVTLLGQKCVNGKCPGQRPELYGEISDEVAEQLRFPGTPEAC